MLNTPTLRSQFRKERLLHGVPVSSGTKPGLDKKAIRGIRNALLIVLFTVLFSIGGCLIAKNCHAYSDHQLANAIRKAEGTWNYGIKTVKCSTESECRHICLRTIKNNRIRYSKDANRGNQTYLVYLSRKYAPIGAGNDPKGLNRNWLKNVSYFLNKEVA